MIPKKNVCFNTEINLLSSTMSTTQIPKKSSLTLFLFKITIILHKNFM